jgi:hypothetical protein
MLYCQQIGKLLFLIAEPKYGALSDKKGLDLAQEYGAIPIEGVDSLDDVIASLV